MTSPTLRQREVMRAIRAHQVARGFPITIRELGDQLGINSTNGVNAHLKSLEHQGLVSREPRRSRTLQLTTAGLREIASG